MNLVHEGDAEELDVPGRKLRWLLHPDGGLAKYCSMCVVTISPGEMVRPAHEHPNGEEVVYVVQGNGRVLVDGEVGTLSEGTAVLFSRGSIHMIKNTGTTPLKLACFFAPPADFRSYRYHDEVSFPDAAL
jgi:quercetin dioxygenase-like cupin family protein